MRVKETEVFIVVSSLTKDMNSSEYAFKANSMKVLAKIIDPENLPSIERYLRQAILDKNPYVQKGALMSGIILFEKAPDSIKKWTTEVQDKLTSPDPQVAYLSLILMSLIKSNDLFSASRVQSKGSKWVADPGDGEEGPEQDAAGAMSAHPGDADPAALRRTRRQDPGGTPSRRKVFVDVHGLPELLSQP